MSFTKLTNTELNSRGATTLPNQPTISAANLKKEFDAPAKEVVAPKFNNLIDELEAPTAAADLGATSPTGRSWGSKVQAIFNAISTALGTVEGSVTTLEGEAHTHDNKALLDTYEQTETDLADAVSKKHSHSNKSLLDSYTQTEANLADAVSKKHAHSNKALLDTYTQTEANLADAVSKKHSHSNKALLDTYDQTNASIKGAVDNTHSHSNKSVLDDVGDNGSNKLTYKGSVVGGGSVNDAYKSVKVTSGSDDTTISASGEDTFELHAGSNVTFSVDTTSTPKKITVNSTGGGGGGSYSAGDGIDITGSTISVDYGTIDSSNTTKPVTGKAIDEALSGKADTSDVPTALSDLSDDTTHRVVTDTEKATWNGKVSELLLKDTTGWVGKNNLPITLAMLKAGNTGGTWSGNVYTQNGVTFTITTNDEGYVTEIDTHTATSASGNANLQLTENKYIPNTFVGDIATGCTDGTDEYYFNINYSNNGTTWESQANQTTTPVTIENKPYIKLAIHVGSGETVTHSKSYPMFRDASITDDTFYPYHKSVEDWYWENNAKLGGVHQLLQISLENLKTYNTAGTWNNNVYTVDGVEYTVNSDHINVNGTGVSSGSTFWLSPHPWNKAFPDGKYNISTKCSSLDGDFKVTVEAPSGTNNNVQTSSGELDINISNISVANVRIYVRNGKTVTNQKIYPLFKLAADTSDEVTDYAMPNKELTDLAVRSDVYFTSSGANIKAILTDALTQCKAILTEDNTSVNGLIYSSGVARVPFIVRRLVSTYYYGIAWMGDHVYSFSDISGTVLVTQYNGTTL